MTGYVMMVSPGCPALSKSAIAKQAKSSPRAGEHNDLLFIVHSGAVELMLACKEQTARLVADGACFA